VQLISVLKCTKKTTRKNRKLVTFPSAHKPREIWDYRFSNCEDFCLWEVRLCNAADRYQCFEVTFCLHLKGRLYFWGKKICDRKDEMKVLDLRIAALCQSCTKFSFYLWWQWGCVQPHCNRSATLELYGGFVSVGGRRWRQLTPKVAS